MSIAQQVRLSEAIDIHRLDIQAQGFTADTQRNYRNSLGHFAKRVPVEYLHEVTPHVIKTYLAKMAQDGKSSAYRHTQARNLKAFLNFCVRDGLLESSPFDKVKMPRLEKKILPALTGEEISTVLDACTCERDRVLVLFALDTGARASELCRLRVEDVDPPAATIRHGKQQKDRVVYLSSFTAKELTKYLIRRGRPGPYEPLFAKTKGEGHIKIHGITHIMRRLRIASGVENLRCHALRRTFAIEMLRSGCDLYTLAKMMGHSGIEVLRQYLDILDDDVRKAHARHSPVDKLRKDRKI